jgi:hypothetical protein
MVFKRLCRRIKLRFFLLQIENDEREEDRSLRQEVIKHSKKLLLLDLMTGHNIGDFQMGEQDFLALQRMSTKTPIKTIRALHSKYRG